MRSKLCATVVPGGDLASHGHRCPLDQFQVLSVTNTATGKTHQICPKCFKDPPAEATGGKAVDGLRCFACLADCPLASGSKVLRPCPSCQRGELLFKAPKAMNGTLLECSNSGEGCDMTAGCMIAAAWAAACAACAAWAGVAPGEVNAPAAIASACC